MIRAFKGNYRISNPFGVYDPVAYVNYPGFLHPGTDYGLPHRTPLYAGMSGNLTRKLWGAKLRKGNEAIITNGNIVRRYGHMDVISRADGWVNEGELIGYSGYTGYVVDSQGNIGTPGGAHLHDELLVDGNYTSLEDYLKGESMSDIADHEFVADACVLGMNLQPETNQVFLNNIGLPKSQVLKNILGYTESSSLRIRAQSADANAQRVKELEVELAALKPTKPPVKLEKGYTYYVG